MNAEIQELVGQWLVKAENDFQAGLAILQADQPPTDTICFHMQQCVEKHLKVYLTFHQEPFRRTHNIAELIEQCKDIAPVFDTLYGLQADTLTIYGIEIRYPDDFHVPTLAEAEQAKDIARTVRAFVRAKLSQSGFDMEKKGPS